MAEKYLANIISIAQYNIVLWIWILPFLYNTEHTFAQILYENKQRKYLLMCSLLMSFVPFYFDNSLWFQRLHYTHFHFSILVVVIVGCFFSSLHPLWIIIFSYYKHFVCAFLFYFHSWHLFFIWNLKMK